MWSDQTPFILFQNDGGVGVGREADGVRHTSRLVPTVQSERCVVIDGHFSWTEVVWAEAQLA